MKQIIKMMESLELDPDPWFPLVVVDTVVEVVETVGGFVGGRQGQSPRGLFFSCKVLFT